MRTISLTILLAVLLRTAPVLAQAPTWSNAWSVPMQGTEQPMGAGLDAAGNIYVTSYLMDFTAEDPANMLTQFLISSSPDGARRWMRPFLAGALSRRGGMDVDDDGNVYVAATFSGTRAIIDRGERLDTIETASDRNILLARYDRDGMLLWHQTLSGSDSIHVTSVAITAGGFWIGGSFTGTVDFGGTRLTSAGRSDAFIAMLDSNGVFHRAIRGGGSSTDECQRIAVDGNGDVVMLGQFRGTASFGDRSVTATGGANFFLARCRADGTVAWADADGGPSFTPAQIFAPMPMLLELDRDGNIYLAISYLNTISINGNVFPSLSEADAILIKYTPEGTGDWALLFGGDFLQLIEGVAIDTDGSIYVAGFSQALPDGTLFLTKLSSNGDQVWQATDMWAGALGGTGGGPICIDAMHNIYVTGDFDGRTRFGDRTITSFGSTDSSIMGADLYIAKIGSTSGVDLARDDEGASFSIALRDREIMLVPAAHAPAVVDAGVYSMLGERVAARSAPGSGDAIRFDASGLARGAYLVVVRTEQGTMGYRVMVGE